MSDAEIEGVLDMIRQAATIPRINYHFDKHAVDFGVTRVAEYLLLFRAHVQRADLRVFTFIRPRGQEAFWALVATETGDTVLYNEKRGRIYSFYRPPEVEIRMRAVEDLWVEVVKGRDGWSGREDWRW